jgi:SAM-dependent methyltransferase
VCAVGIDASDGMLKIARARDASVQWILGDIRSPPVEGKFDLVFCCFNTLQFLHLDQDLVQAFGAARELIGANGVFAFDIYQPNLAYLENSQSDKLARSLVDRDGRALEIREDSSYDPRTQVLSLNWRLQEKGSPDRQPLARTSFHLRQFFARDLGRLLRDAGLVVHERYGDFGNQPFNARSRKQILICGSD